MADLARIGETAHAIHNVMRGKTLRLVDNNHPVHQTTVTCRGLLVPTTMKSGTTGFAACPRSLPAGHGGLVPGGPPCWNSLVAFWNRTSCRTAIASAGSP